MSQKKTKSEAASPRIKRSTVTTLIEQNRAMRELLESWPAREIMMDYEKEWNERRQRFLERSPEVEL